MVIHVIIDGRLTSGTAQGQMIFWDNTLKKWVFADTDELFWDDTNKRFGIKTATPSSELEVAGTITTTRMLAGRVKE